MPEAPKTPRSAPTAADSTSAEAMRAVLARQLDGPDDPAGPPPAIPDHQLLHRIGRGAYGEVWLARNALGTLRAVKVVYRARFQEDRPYEREFHGILKYEPVSRSHGGMVHVLHVGRDEARGCFYYVMELADSVGTADVAKPNSPNEEEPEAPPVGRYLPRTLRSELASCPRLPPADAAQLVLRLAGALGHLHAHGLVHRDIKPSNVIFVGGQPKLADIGLVTDVGSSRSFVGTEGFIPPEGPGTPQADIYGLGKLLYELATGCDRLEFPQLPRLKQRAAGGHSASPGTDAEAEALLELNEVMIRACTPDPANRYANAMEFQADLNLFLAGRSLRRMRNVERHLARLKRFAVAACVFLVLAAGALWFVKNEERHATNRARDATERASAEAVLRQRAESAELDQSRLREEAQNAQAEEARSRQYAEGQELAARKKAYASDMKLLQQALAADDLGHAQDLLNRQRPQPGEEDMRGWEWRYLWQFCQSDAAFTLCQRSSSILSVSFSSDGAWLAVGGAFPTEVTIWDVARRQMLSSFESLRSTTGRPSFAPNGDTLAVSHLSNQINSIVLWNARIGTELHRLPAPTYIQNLAFTRDGRLFAANANRSDNVAIWDAARGDLVGSFTAKLPNYINCPHVAITSNAHLFAHVVRGASGSVQVMDANGAVDPPFRVAEEVTTALAFSPDGQTLVTGAGYAEGRISVWHARTGQRLGSLEGHRSWVSCLKFSPDGKTLASSSADRTIRLWDFETRRPLRTLRGRGGELWSIDISPDGRWLASGGKDGSVTFWDLTSSTNRPPVGRTLPGNGVGRWSFAPDSRSLGVAREPGLKIYDANTFHLISEPALSLSNISGMAFSPKARLLVASDNQGNLGAWDLQGQRMVTNFVAHASAAELGSVFVSKDRSVLTYGLEGVFKEWDTATWKEARQWPIESGLVAWASSPEANLVATATRAGGFELIPIHAPEKRRRFTGQARIKALNLAPDGQTLAAASENGTVELWDTDTLTRKALLRGVLLGYHSVTISPDGERVAAGSNGQEAIKLWDLHSHEEVATLAGQGSFFTDAAFSPDGNTIGARNWNGVLHLWTAPSWEQIEAAEKKAAATTP